MTDIKLAMRDRQDKNVAAAKETFPPRGRPRSFDPEAAVATAQALFERHGYDGVGIADLGRELGLAAPSLYAAFGSKAGLFARVIERYAATGGAYIEAAFVEPDVADGVARLLREGALAFSLRDGRAGCLVLDGARTCNDPVASEAIAEIRARTRRRIVGYIATRWPDRAEALADFVWIGLAGLSSAARDGIGVGALDRFAVLAGQAFRSETERAG